MDKNINKNTRAIRWIARILGTILAVVLGYSLVVGLIMNFGNPDLIVYGSAAFLIIIVVGVIVAWFKEKIGGIILVTSAVVAIISGIIAGLINPNFDVLTLIPFAIPLLIIGILFLVYWWKSEI